MGICWIELGIDGAKLRSSSELKYCVTSLPLTILMTGLVALSTRNCNSPSTIGNYYIWQCWSSATYFPQTHCHWGRDRVTEWSHWAGKELPLDKQHVDRQQIWTVQPPPAVLSMGPLYGATTADIKTRRMSYTNITITLHYGFAI